MANSIPKTGTPEYEKLVECLGFWCKNPSANTAENTDDMPPEGCSNKCPKCEDALLKKRERTNGASILWCENEDCDFTFCCGDSVIKLKLDYMDSEFRSSVGRKKSFGSN